MRDYIRIFNDDGIAEFRAYLHRLRNGAKEQPPTWMLTDSETSMMLSPTVEIELKVFGSRFEFGQYLVTTLELLGRRSISHHYALWTWVSLYYFDELCPPLADGTRRVLEDAVLSRYEQWAGGAQ